MPYFMRAIRRGSALGEDEIAKAAPTLNESGGSRTLNESGGSRTLNESGGSGSRM